MFNLVTFTIIALSIIADAMLASDETKLRLQVSWLTLASVIIGGIVTWCQNRRKEKRNDAWAEAREKRLQDALDAASERARKDFNDKAESKVKEILLKLEEAKSTVANKVDENTKINIEALNAANGGKAGTAAAAIVAGGTAESPVHVVLDPPKT